MPLYAVGLLGMTRRLQHYDQPQWHPWLLVAEAGALLILCGIALQAAQLFVSIRSRRRRVEPTGDRLGWTYARVGDVLAAAAL